MIGQISIFDLLQQKEEVVIENMTSEQLAEKIGFAIGMKFVKSGWLDEYVIIPKKNLKMTVKKSYYSCDTYNRKKGDAFISCGYSYKDGGCGCPIDSMEDAINFFRRFIKEYIA